MAKNDGGVNYIRHLLCISEKFNEDRRLSPWHISLYYALFQSWNLSKFSNPISVCRSELMQASKIGSANTYTKCLKELDKWGYIKYHPSYNPVKGSLIYLYNFNKGSDNGTDKGSDNSTDKAPVMVLIPSINSINKLNNTNNLIVDEQKKSQSLKMISKEKLSEEKSSTERSRSIQPFIIPELEEVKKYFVAQKYPELEAEKFYNHFQSNGWLVGGRSKMKDWKAASRNWIINGKKFNQTKRNSNVTTEKNYGEPL